VTLEPAQNDVLRTSHAGAKVIRGGTLRGSGYVAGIAFGTATSILLLRYLGPEAFGRFATVGALVAIAGGVTDAGLSAVGAREISLLPPGAERERLLRTLVTLRVLLTTVGVAGATVFALLVGYDSTLVWGTVIAGIGVVLANTQMAMMMPLSVELRLGMLTALELVRHALTLVGVTLLVAVGASLIAFFGVQVAVGLVLLVATPLVVGWTTRFWAATDRESASFLLRESLPLGLAIAMSVIYMRVLVVLMSLLADETETGLFATSFRVFEVLFGLPLLVLSVALPVLAVAAREDEERLRYSLQRLTEVGLLLAVGLVLLIVVLAEPMLVLIGGEEYRDAAPVLKIQALALVPVFLGQAWQLGLISVRRHAALTLANGTALMLVVVIGIVLIPGEGAVGAAVAAVVSEVVLAALLLAFLLRTGQVPLRLGLTPRIAAAGAIACIPLALGLSAGTTALLVGAAYVAVSTALRSVPVELLAAFTRPRADDT
jgi:O-antigen/teichoic acid export membrane protein